MSPIRLFPLTIAAMLLLGSFALANDSHDALLQMNEADQKAAFEEILKSSGESCDSVTRVFFQALSKQQDTAIWNVGCKNGHEYALLLYPGEEQSMLLHTCEDVRHVAPCWTKLQ